MKRALIAIAVLAAAILPAVDAATKPAKLKGTLKGTEETPLPASPSTGTGTVAYTISADRTKIFFTLRVSSLSGLPQAAHVHLGPKGKSGPVLLTLRQTQFGSGQGARITLTGRLTRGNANPQNSATAFARSVSLMLAGKTYTNVHTVKFPAGEVRGQNVVTP